MGYICYSCSSQLKGDIPRLLESHGSEVKIIREPELDFESDMLEFFCSRGTGKASFAVCSKIYDVVDEGEQLFEGKQTAFEGDELPVSIFPIIPEHEKGWKGLFKSGRPNNDLVRDIKKLLLDNGAILRVPIDGDRANP